MNKAFSCPLPLRRLEAASFGLAVLSASLAGSSGLPPALAITRSGTNVVVSWPSNGTEGLSLTTATQWPSATWTPVTPVVLQGTNYTTSAPLAQAPRFFQLKAGSIDESNYDSADNWNFPNDNY